MGEIAKAPRKITKAELVMVTMDALLIGDVQNTATEETVAGLRMLVQGAADEIFRTKLNPRRVRYAWAMSVMSQTMHQVAHEEGHANDG